MKHSAIRRYIAAILSVLMLCMALPTLSYAVDSKELRSRLNEINIPIDDDFLPTAKTSDALQFFSDDPLKPYEQIHADTAWDYETYGNEVNVAVIDTGCTVHSALADTLKKNYFFEASESEENEYIMYETNGSTDVHGHGTHVAGIIAAQLSGAYSGNVKGIAPKVNLYVFNATNTDADGKVTGINPGLALISLEYAVYELNCRVVNMSFGAAESAYSSEELEYLQACYQEAYDNGVILVAAAGNNGNATRNYPAAFDGVIGVGAVNSQNARSSFSVMNNTIDVVAPGGDVKKSTVSGSMTEYIWSLDLKEASIAGLRGTSQASPHVAGAAALMLSVDPDLTPAEFEALLQTCSTKIHGDDYDATDGYGYGLLNVEGMFNALTEGQSCYIAPAADDHITLFNLTDSPITCSAFFATYDTLNTLTDCTAEPLSLAAQGKWEKPLTDTVCGKLFALLPQSLAPLSCARNVR